MRDPGAARGVSGFQLTLVLLITADAGRMHRAAGHVALMKARGCYTRHTLSVLPIVDGVHGWVPPFRFGLGTEADSPVKLQGPCGPAVPCCAVTRVRFPSARNDRGNIYTVARAHLIFMGSLFIDGERLPQHPQRCFFRLVPLKSLWLFLLWGAADWCQVRPQRCRRWHWWDYPAKELCGRGKRRRLQDSSLGQG